MVSSGGAGGHLFHALNRLPHPPSLWWAWLFVYICVWVCRGMYLCLCAVWVSWHVTSLLLSVRGKGDLLSGCRLVSQTEAYELQYRSLVNGYHLLFTPKQLNGKHFFMLTRGSCKTYGHVRQDQQYQAFRKLWIGNWHLLINVSTHRARLGYNNCHAVKFIGILHFTTINELDSVVDGGPGIKPSQKMGPDCGLNWCTELVCGLNLFVGTIDKTWDWMKTTETQMKQFCMCLWA